MVPQRIPSALSMAQHQSEPRFGCFPLGDLQRELDAALAYPHGLGLHELESSRITLLGPGPCHGVERLVQPLPFPGDLGLSRPQLRQAFHSAPPYVPFLFCIAILTVCPGFRRFRLINESLLGLPKITTIP